MVDFPEESGPMFKWSRVEAVEGAFDLLYVLSQRADCYVATNAKDSSEILISGALNRVGMVPFIKKIFCFQSVGYEKPSKEFFDAVISELKCEKSDVVMVGDNLNSDIYGALNYGIDAVWFNKNREEVPGNIVSIDNLLQIID